MTPSVALLTIATALAAAPPAGPAAVEGLERAERVVLPALAGPVKVEVRALQRLVVVDSPRAVAPLVRALQRSPRSICPTLEETSTGAALRCVTARLVARLDRTRTGYVLEVAETHGLPWGGDDATPTVGAELGEDAAAIHAGDLALARGDVSGAASQWGRVRAAPWDRLAAARLCELSMPCAGSPRADAYYRLDGLPAALATDLVLRRARALAYTGRAHEGASLLLSRVDLAPLCGAAAGLCRAVALAALDLPGPGAVDGLVLWSSLPEQEHGPASYAAALGVAAAAEREGAYVYAAQVLGSVAQQAPPRALNEHLLRTAELFLRGGDDIRAGVIVEFARARAGKGGLRGERWAAVVRSTSGARPEAPARRAGPDLAALQSSVERDLGAARAASQGAPL